MLITPTFERLKRAARLAHRQFVALAVLLAAALVPCAAQAAVITFDDLSCGLLGAPIVNGYGDSRLNWDNFRCVDGTLWAPISGYHTGVVSDPNVAYNSEANPGTLTASGAAKFNLNSVYLTAAYDYVPSGIVKIVASRGGQEVMTKEVTVLPTAYGQVVLSWVNIDKVVFTSVVDTNGNTYQFVMDNLDISFGPAVTTNPATTITATGATLRGSVNPAGVDSTAGFQYGPTTAYGSTAPATPGSIAASSGDTAVSAMLTGLSCNTTYHFRVTANNTNGTNSGADQSFTTSACPPSAMTTPATSITATGATLHGMINDGGGATTATFDYGTTTAYGSTVAAMPSSIAAGSGDTQVSLALTSLSCNTTYHFRVTAQNTNSTQSGADQSFLTDPCVPAAPVIDAATPGVGSATLAFGLPSDGGAPVTRYTATCEPGGVTASGSASPITVTGLTPGQTYTCSVTATNKVGTGPASAPVSVTALLPAPVPTLSEWGLLLLGTLLGATALRRRVAHG